MEILNTVFYFALTIGVLVLVHEFGHFAAAKFFGMRVDRFSLGFPPRAFGKQIGETDYCVSWIPIGGYVKIAGMIDESFDTDFLKQAPQPWEFRAKPAWQRMIVLAAGVIMNVLLAIAIFWGIIYLEGKVVRPVTEIAYVMPESVAANAGIHIGDKIVSINSTPIKYWDEIESTIYGTEMGKDIGLVIERAGEQISLAILRSEIPDISDERFGVYPAGMYAVVSRVEEGMPASAIGIQQGDILRTINGEQVSYHLLPTIMNRNAGKEITLGWRRGTEEIEASAVVTQEGRIGIAFGATYEGPLDRIQFGIAGALVESIKDVGGISVLFVKSVYQIIAGRVSFEKSVGGPIKIAQIATQSAKIGASSFLTIMAWLSMSLAILNLLPFPALDGGHLMFLGIETLFKREIPTRIKLGIQQVGFVALLVFMAFVLYNDIANF